LYTLFNLFKHVYNCIVLIPEEETQDISQAEVLADFQQVLHEAMTGQTVTFSQLWDGLEND
jgi:hypothetical protein